MNQNKPKKQKPALFVVAVTFFVTLLSLAFIAGMVYVFVNYDSLKDNITFDKTYNMKIYEKEVSNWQNEPNRVEIPALGIIGKLSFAKSKEDEESLLRDSLVHILGTALPGEKGNVVITGHSSSLYPGAYQNIFATLGKLESGDRIIIYKDNVAHNYEVDREKVVSSDDISVLNQNDERLTLLTCWPIGTNLQRLIVTARVVD